MVGFLNIIKRELDSIKEKGLYRSLKNISSPTGTVVTINGKRYLNFCSNNYHGLANHPALVNHLKESGQKWGIGAGASRLICGNMEIHQELEQRIAEFKGAPAGLILSSGYMTNLGLLGTLGTEDTTIFSDRLNHASIIDGCRLSKAKIRVYNHMDMDHLDGLLKKDHSPRKIIITEGVFSMDGDIPPLDTLYEIKNRYGALLIVDDAHATGVLGRSGRGSAEYWNMEGKIDVQMGTFSKAFGTYGGFICSSPLIKEYFINRCRPLIFNTAIPPVIADLTIKAMDIFESNTMFISRLRHNIALFKQLMKERGFKIDSCTPIIPIIIGDSDKTVSISNRLMERGIFISAIRPPTVPEGTSRLRITLSSAHTSHQIEQLADTLIQTIKEHRIVHKQELLYGIP